MSHPAQDLDEVVHQKNRLAILAILSEARKVEFTYLQKALDLTGGNLSRHLQVLEASGLVQVEKGYEGRRPRTWIHITKPSWPARGGRRPTTEQFRQPYRVASQSRNSRRSESPPRGGSLGSSHEDRFLSFSSRTHSYP